MWSGPELKGPATPCQDLDPAELGSSAAASVLGALDENEFLALVPNSQSDILDEETQQRRDARREGDGRDTGNTVPHKQDDTEGLVNALSDKEEETVRSLDKDPSPRPSQARSGDQIETHGDEFDSYSAGPDGSGGRPRPAKRKRPSSPDDDLTKKRKYPLLTSTHYSRARLVGCRRSERSPASHSDRSTSRAEYNNTKGRVPSPVASIADTANREIRSSSSGLGRPSKNGLPTLTEITFRPQSPHSYAFTAVVRDVCQGQGVSFSQLAQLIKGIGYVGKLGDFTIKPLEQESLLLSGVCHSSFQPVPNRTPALPRHAKAHTPSKDAARTRLMHGRPVRAVVERHSTAGISDDNSLSDSDSHASSDDDGCRSEDEQGGSSPRKHVPWDEIDEQRLRVYKEEGKAWKWIFKKFPTRTEPAIRSRWTIIQQRAE